jgi:SAM-dependent methyltransferase
VSDAVQTAALGSFRHRQDYREVSGRDRWTVRAVNEWVSSVLPPLLESGTVSGGVLDVGCGEQPFRPLIEASARRYVGMDVVQNSTNSVEIVSALEQAPSPTVAFAAILCTEVLEHVEDIDAAFAGLRRLVAGDGVVVLTVPFVFPLHMEPYDFRRLTLHGIRRLAGDHGFQVERATPLGALPNVLATLVADASILPASRSLYSRVKVGALRAASAALVRLLDSERLSRSVVINSNCYLSNGIVLRAV